MARALMFMGTGSDVGKSLIVAGLCRAFVNRGLRVAPFKPQNMSNNAAVTADGGEIGRAQALQARAARRQPLTAMNPVLLKPEHESGSQVVVRGKRVATMTAREYWANRASLLPQVVDSFAELQADADLVLVEGAGSASEVNLRKTDIANFGFAREADVPVVVIGDIGRGGVIASLVGTFEVIAKKDAKLIAATLVNRFQGDTSLFADGLAAIAEKTGVPCLGPVPFFPDARKLPAEDSLALEAMEPGQGDFVIAVPRLPRIANFDDLDPLRSEPGVKVVMVPPGEPLPLCDLVIIPGSKSTIGDLRALIEFGWDIDIKAHARRGGAVLGICGGYQMLGLSVADLMGIEGPPDEQQGLGLLNTATVLTEVKQLRIEQGTHVATGETITGYHMHMGAPAGPPPSRVFATVNGAGEGAVSADGRIMGTYLHGLFAADRFRAMFLKQLGASPSLLRYEAGVDAVLDGLAAHLEQHLDLDLIYAMAR